MNSWRFEAQLHHEIPFSIPTQVFHGFTSLLPRFRRRFTTPKQSLGTLVVLDLIMAVGMSIILWQFLLLCLTIPTLSQLSWLLPLQLIPLTYTLSKSFTLSQKVFLKSQIHWLLLWRLVLQLLCIRDTIQVKHFSTNTYWTFVTTRI